MAFSETEKKAARNALTAGLDFALVRYPEEESFRFICDNGKRNPALTDTEFFIVPWLGKWGDRTVIADRLTAEEAANMVPGMYHRENLKEIPRNTDHNKYIQRVGALIEKLRGTGGKTVISRTICGEMAGADAIDIADRYFDRSRHAVCALAAIEGDIMIIASPETLLCADISLKMFSTMALAGTRKAGTEGAWDRKNIDEQALVTEFIVSKLEGLGMEPVCEETETAESSNVEHLRTMITGRCTKMEECTAMLDALSPTPALCGSPREISINRIKAIEEHDRGFYGGYFGLSDSESIDASVTLRCALVRDGRYCIYAGGGITAESDPETEWQETCMKAATLNTLFQKQSTNQTHGL